MMNSRFEEMYLARGIFPGARMFNPRYGPGTVIECRITSPYQFSFLPDDELEVEEEGMLRLFYYDPTRMRPGWEMPERNAEGSIDWVPLEIDDDVERLEMHSDYRIILNDVVEKMSTFQIAGCIKHLVTVLRDRETKEVRNEAQRIKRRVQHEPDEPDELTE
jgi:hypothetical protein